MVYVAETFEGYGSTAEMQANWGSTGLGTLDTTRGNPGKSAFHPGGAVNSWTGPGFSLLPDANTYVMLTADIYDDGTSQNERISVGLRNGANPLLEMGHYNNTPEHYHARILNFAGNNNWVPISPGLRAASGQPAGWNRYQARIGVNDILITIDLGADGTIDGSLYSSGVDIAAPFVDLRFGGPSNLSSPGGGVFFDNIRLETVAVPEPSAALLALVGCVGGLLRRRR